MENLENINADFDPMAENSSELEAVTKEEFDEIQNNGVIVKNFYEKYRGIGGKHDAIFIDGINEEWTKEDAELYANYLREKKSIPTDRWNTARYCITLVTSD